MPVFETLFRQSNFEPISYKGKKLFFQDVFPVKDREKLRVVFESVNSDWRQGVELQTTRRPGYYGWFIIDGKKVMSRVILGQDTSPPVVEFILRTKDGKLYVNNAWEKPPETWAAGITYIDSRSSGAAMVVEELPNGRRYRCNDGHPDEDFDDIVFRIERVGDDQKGNAEG